MTQSLDDGRITFGEAKQGRMKDPVCSMYVNPENPSVEFIHHKDKTFYFCSQQCKIKYEKNPDLFPVNT